MAVDKLVDSTKLDNALEYTADRIRLKTGGSSDIAFDFANETGFGSAIDSIQTAGTYQAKTGVHPSTLSQTITPDSGYDALSSVQIDAMNLRNKTVTPSTEAITVTANDEYVNVTGTMEHTTGYWRMPITWTTQPVNGETYDVYFYWNRSGKNRLFEYTGEITWNNGAFFSAKSGGHYANVTLTSTYATTDNTFSDEDDPNTYSGVILRVYGGNYDGLSQVTVSAITAGTAGTPSATKGTVSNHSVTVTPSVTNTTGYITGGTITGTAVTVNVAELEFGTLSITENGTGISVSGYSTVDVSVSGGGGTTWETLYDKSIWISASNPNYFIISNYTDAFSADQTYRITWGSGGTQYICQTILDERGQTYDGYVAGNVGLVGDTPDTGEPFFLYRDSATRLLGVTNASSGNWHITIELQTGSGSSKNVQVAQSGTRRNSTTLGSIISLTCSKTGTYDVYWTCARTNTSQTWGSQLYINDASYGTENTTWSNNVQNNHLTGVSISANQTVAVYGRSRSTSYYIYASQLTIIEN